MSNEVIHIRRKNLSLLSDNFRYHAERILELGQRATMGFDHVEFCAFETLRTKERQKYLLEQNRTKTLNSKHITGDAIDIVLKIDGKWTWNFEYWYIFLAHLVKQDMGDHVTIAALDWGWDLVHYELK